MHIVFAASECAPFAKTGGLADVVAELPRELVKLGQQVTVYLPLYKTARPFLKDELTFAVRSITIPFPDSNRFVGIVDGGVEEGVQFYFVDHPDFFDRDGLYGPKSGAGDWTDNAARFGLFSRAVIEATKQLGVPDIFHLHDWETAFVPILLRTVYASDPALRSAGTVFTVHNAGYQGSFPPSTVGELLLPAEVFTVEKLAHYNMFNALKGALVYADYLTTVSHTYAEEIQTAEYGDGLDGVLKARHMDLRGILNGVDYSEWDPGKDPNLAAHYSAADLAGKAECRRDLLHAFGLRDVADSTAVVGIVSRLATQKGFDLVAEIADRLTERDLVFAVLGTGEPYYENFFRDWAARSPTKVATQIKFDDALEHKVEAGSDMLLMPSRYEPCGLNQIYSMKYGTVPVVRATGGLEDTVVEWSPNSSPEAASGTGFKFYGLDSDDLLAAVDRALGVFGDKAQWEKLMRNGMAQNHGWEQPAKEYVEVYNEVLRRRG